MRMVEIKVDVVTARVADAAGARAGEVTEAGDSRSS